MAGARVRQREAGRQAEFCGVGVDADQPLGILDPGDRHERRRPVSGLAPPGAVRRQTRQPERRNRRVVKSPLLASPFEPDRAAHVDRLGRPLARQGQARLDQPRRAGEGAGQIAPRRCGKPRARRGGDLEPRVGRARKPGRLAIGARQHDERRRAPLSRGEQQAAGGGEAVALEAPDFADDRGRRAGFQRLLHRPEGRLGVGRPDEDDPAQGEAVRGEARPVERARLALHETFADEKRGRRPTAEEARGERKREARRRGPVGGRGRGDLVQGVVGQPPAKGRIERTRQRETPRGALKSHPFDLRDDAPQTRHLRPATERHFSLALMFDLCSCFEPRRSESQGRADTEPERFAACRLDAFGQQPAKGRAKSSRTSAPGSAGG